jgi:hypothetical protein
LSYCRSYPLKCLIFAAKIIQGKFSFCAIFIDLQLHWIDSYHLTSSLGLPKKLLLQALRRILESRLEHSHSHWNSWFILFSSAIPQYGLFYLGNLRKFQEHGKVNLIVIILICLWNFEKYSDSESPYHHLQIWILCLPSIHFIHFFHLLLDLKMNFPQVLRSNFEW